MPERPPTRIRLQGFKCVNCQYDLSGNSFGDRCPECGWDVGDSLRMDDFYTRDYALRVIVSAIAAVATFIVPVLALYFAHAAWRWHQGAAECCEDEKVQASQAWLRWSRAALLLAMVAACVNLLVTLQASLWAWRWLSRHW